MSARAGRPDGTLCAPRRRADDLAVALERDVPAWLRPVERAERPDTRGLGRPWVAPGGDVDPAPASARVLPAADARSVGGSCDRDRGVAHALPRPRSVPRGCCSCPAAVTEPPVSPATAAMSPSPYPGSMMSGATRMRRKARDGTSMSGGLILMTAPPNPPLLPARADRGLWLRARDLAEYECVGASERLLAVPRPCVRRADDGKAPRRADEGPDGGCGITGCARADWLRPPGDGPRAPAPAPDPDPAPVASRSRARRGTAAWREEPPATPPERALPRDALMATE